MYFSYDEITLAVWSLWRRRIAREQRSGTWLISLTHHQDVTLFRTGLGRLRLRCAIEIIQNHDTNSFEFIPI